jgi:hypothetical protein
MPASGLPAFLTGGTINRNSRLGETAGGQEAPRTAGLEAGATIFAECEKCRLASREKRRVNWVANRVDRCKV